MADTNMAVHTVDVPGHGPIEFPASMSQAEIENTIRTKILGNNDIAKSAAIGIPKGASGVVGLPGNARELANAELGWIEQNLPESLKPTYEKAKAAFSGPGGKLIGGPTAEMARLYNIVPSSHQIQSGLENITGKWYQPKTKAGQYAEALTTGATGALMGGGATGAIDRAIAGGLSELTGKLGKDIGGEGPAGTALSIVGSIASPSLYGAVRGAVSPNAAELLRKNTEGVTEEQWAGAQRLIDLGRQKGIKITVPEALNHPAILSLAGDVKASPSGSAILDKFLTERAEQQVIPALRNLGLPNVSQRQAGESAQEAATKYLSAREASRTANWKTPPGTTAIGPSIPTHEILKTVDIPKNEINAIISDIDSKLATTAEGTAAFNELSTLKDQLSKNTNASALNSIVNDAQARISIPAIGANSMSKAATALVSPILSKVNNTISTYVPQFGRAENAYKVRSEALSALEGTPTGKIAGVHGYETGEQPKFGMVEQELLGTSNSPREVVNTARRIGTQNAQAVPNVIGAHLNKQLNLAATETKAGTTPQNVGATFAQNVAGNPARKANLIALLKQTDKQNNTNLAQDVEDILSVVKTTGRIPGVGSPTATRQSNQQMAGQNAMADLLDVPKGSSFGTITKALKDRTYSKTYQELATNIKNMDANQIRAYIEKSPELRKQILTAYLLSQSAAQGEQ